MNWQQKVQRYDPAGPGFGGMRATDDGDFVLYCDYDQLSQRLAEASVLLATRVEASRLDEAITRAEQAEAKLALAEQDARRYRWLRDNCHHNEYDGRDWPHAVIVLQWDDGSHICKFHPDKNAPGVGLISLDNAIDSVMQRAAIDASGHESLPPHKEGG